VYQVGINKGITEIMLLKYLKNNFHTRLF